MGWQQARIIISVACTVISVVLTFALLRPSPESMGLKPFGYDPNATEAAAADPSKKPGCTPAEARKSPALYMLMLVAGFFVISASFVQQLSRYCSTMPELGAPSALWPCPSPWSAASWASSAWAGSAIASAPAPLA